MVEEVQIAELPTGKLGLYGGRNMTRINGEYLLQADNIAYNEGVARKEGGASAYRISGGIFGWTSVGSAFSITPSAGNYSITGLSASDIAYIDTQSDELRTYRFSSGSWAQVGNSLSIATTGGLHAISALDSDDVAYIDDFNDELRTYNFDGTNWSQVGSSLAISTVGTPAITSLNSTDIAFIDATNEELRTYRFNGSTWSQVGNSLSISGVTSPAVAAIDADDVAYIDETNGELRTYHFDGTDWAQVGNSLAIDNGAAITALAALNSTDIAFINDNSSGIRVYRWDGSDWSEQPGRTTLAGLRASIAKLASDEIAIVEASDDQIVKYEYAIPTLTAVERGNNENITLNGVSFNGSTYCAVGNADGTDAYIITSTDLGTWTQRSNGKNVSLNDIEWNGQIFCAVGAADGTDAYILISSDGISWEEVSNPKNVTLNSIAFNGLYFVAVGESDGADSYILTSNDGRIWTERVSPVNVALNGISWSGDLFVAVGDASGSNSTLITSPDGVAWTSRSGQAPKNAGLNAVEWNGLVFAAIGNADGSDAFVLTSSDGLTWTEQENPKNFDLYDLVWNGVAFMAVGAADGADSYVLLSQDGEVWGEIENTKNISLNGIAWDKANFICVGSADGTDAYLVTYAYDTFYLLGGAYWNYDGNTPKILAVDTDGRIIMDDFDGEFSTIVDSGLTVNEDTNPQFVEGGKEVAANNRKMFVFTGSNPVQVISGAATTSSDLATPPADWSSSNQPTGGLIHEGILWGFGNANDPHRLYYSETTDNEDFTGSGAGSLAIYPGEGEKIVNAVSFKGYIIVFKYPKGIYFVDTTSALTQNWRVGRISSKIGAAGLGSAEPVENDVIFVDRTGEIRALSGVSQFGDIGTRSLSDINGVSTWIRDNYYLPDNTKWRMAYYPTKRELHIAASRNQLGINDSRLVIDFNNDVPMFRYSHRDTCISLFTREVSGVAELMSTDNLGNMYRMDQDDRNKDGLGYSAKVQIPYIDVGNPVQNKNGRYIEIAYEPTGDYDLIIDIIWDGVYYETVTMNLSAEGSVIPGRMIVQRLVEIGGFGKRFSMIFRNGNPDEDFRIQAAWLHYTLGAAA